MQAWGKKPTGGIMEEQNEIHPSVPISAKAAQTKEQGLREGRELFRVGRDAEALHAFEKVIRLDPTNIEAYYYKSALLRAMLPEEEEISEEAIDVSQMVLSLSEEGLLRNPTDIDAYFYKGSALCDLGRYEEAILAYEQIIRLAPANSAGYNNVGNALACLNRHEEAISMYEQALRLDPTNTRVYVSIGHALRSLGRITEAEIAYEKARLSVPRNAQ